MKKLELKFENADQKTVTFSLDNPIEPVDPQAVSSAMDEIISQGALITSGGDLTGKKSARVVDTVIEEIELT
ncbi:DUF2922 domain-containing protein [Virgibacillus sp. 179-BFC.A HS]|uniref:DUF2922 domain-containing protein n=1 Tax=Tigheibacillus jepli TaxID=3035914 RepID=A0ABU5CEI6_9BACI|nr:DUF2922 domain-containing protein [Virgibacillus sp. 179-BFC.A HS]MDY0404745.1 DUF2922 domain-containing protein [Virgibacillus sp. 179-BFC.A HS]